MQEKQVTLLFANTISEAMVAVNEHKENVVMMAVDMRKGECIHGS